MWYNRAYDYQLYTCGCSEVKAGDLLLVWEHYVMHTYIGSEDLWSPPRTPSLQYLSTVKGLLELWVLSKVMLSCTVLYWPAQTPFCCSPFGCTAYIQYISSLHVVHMISICLTSSLRSNNTNINFSHLFNLWPLFQQRSIQCPWAAAPSGRANTASKGASPGRVISRIHSVRKQDNAEG